MSNHLIESVTLTLDAQTHRRGQFSLPKQVCDLFGVGNNDEVALSIESPNGGIEVIKQLKSGLEIYGAELEEVVGEGERIRVTVSLASGRSA